MNILNEIIFSEIKRKDRIGTELKITFHEIEDIFIQKTNSISTTE